ncbi:MAG: recombination mediator RecR [Bacteroidales bacterium]|nr:recombination mediator RecR [Bacteroidales bacterium]
MSFEQFSSKLFESAVNEFASLPGIGKKTALRLVLALLRQEDEEVKNFGNTFIQLKENIHYCTSCNNISDSEICSICANPSRDHETICIVENIRDVMAVENTHQYRGIYHVLGGIISPMDGIGPDDLEISILEEKIKVGQVKELIMALSTTMEGDTTNFYLFKRFSKYSITITTLARGVSIGDELEYADEITLGKSILNRTPLSDSLSL